MQCGLNVARCASLPPSWLAVFCYSHKGGSNSILASLIIVQGTESSFWFKKKIQAALLSDQILSILYLSSTGQGQTVINISLLEEWCMHAKSLQLCPPLCDPMDCSLPGSSVHGILQARILEWVAVPSSMGSSQPRDRTHVSCVSSLAGGFFTTGTTRKVEWPSKQWFSKYSPLGNSISITCRLGGNTRSWAPP